MCQQANWPCQKSLGLTRASKSNLLHGQNAYLFVFVLNVWRSKIVELLLWGILFLLSRLIGPCRRQEVLEHHQFDVRFRTSKSFEA